MKRALPLFTVIILITGVSGYSWYISNYEGPNYYVYVHKDYKYEKEKEVSHKGRKEIQYTYSLKGFDEKGKEQELNFTTLCKLKTGVYLEVLYNKEKGTATWEERNRCEIPNNALDQLE